MKTSFAKSLKRLVPVVALMAGSLTLMQCAVSQPDPVAIKVVAPPFRNVDVPSQALSFKAEEGAEFQMPNGTRINIPPAAIVDEAGKPINGQVDLNYREFHDATDIIASGITMEYKAGALEGHLQTAGMMEIKAFQKEKPVFIAPGKQIDIALATFAPQPDMNLYYLDEKTGWVQQGQPAEMPNEQKVELPEASVKKMDSPPVQPEKIKKGEFVFGFIPNYDQFPELKAFKGIEWKYAGTDSTSDPQKNKLAFKKVWSDMRLKSLNPEEQTYSLLLTTPIDTFRTTVKPAFRGKNFDMAMEEFNKKNEEYTASLAARQEAEKRAVVQADILYSFGVSRFGTWNCDRFYNMPDVVNITMARMNIGGFMGKVVSVFHITGEGKVVIQYANGQMTGFRFSPSEDNRLVAVLEGNRVAVMNQKNFDKLDLSSIRQSGKCELQLETLGQEVTSVEDLDRILASN